MTSTRSAAATGMPIPPHTFLRQLASLPLIGGGITLVGQPTAIAEPVTYRLLDAYKTWLHFEFKQLAFELADHQVLVDFYGQEDRESRVHQASKIINFHDIGETPNFHKYDGSAPASDRAALVLSAVGCNWREDCK